MSPSTNHLRNRTTLTIRIDPCSAGFAGAFIDREVETRGVRREDLIATKLQIHTLIARLLRQRKGKARRFFLFFHLFVVFTVCAN